MERTANVDEPTSKKQKTFNIIEQLIHDRDTDREKNKKEIFLSDTHFAKKFLEDVAKYAFANAQANKETRYNLDPILKFLTREGVPISESYFGSPLFFSGSRKDFLKRMDQITNKYAAFMNKFLEKARWQFAMLLHDVVKAAEQKTPYQLDNGEERVYNLLPEPVKQAIEDFVVHPDKNSEEQKNLEQA